MGAVQQILVGTGMLTLSALMHVVAVAFGAPLLKWLALRLDEEIWPKVRVVALLSMSVFVLVFAHTVQVWSWAILFFRLSELPDVTTSFYFATVTYTTLGYGDIVLGEGARIIATFCAIAGLLTFGISTAFLLNVLSGLIHLGSED